MKNQSTAEADSIRYGILGATDPEGADPDEQSFLKEAAVQGFALPHAHDLDEMSASQLLEQRNAWRAFSLKAKEPGALRIASYNVQKINTTLGNLKDYGGSTLKDGLFAAARAQGVNVDAFPNGKRAQVPIANRANLDGFTDMATGKRIVAIDKWDGVNGIAQKMGIDISASEFGMAEYLRGVAGMQPSRHKDVTRAVMNTLTEGTGSQGGYLVPSILWPRFLDALIPASTLLDSGVPILTLDQGALNYTIAAAATIPVASFRSEAAAIASSDPVFGKVVITPRSLAFTVDVSREALADAANIEGQIMHMATQAFAVAIDATGLRGNGTPPNPTGILNAANVNAVANGTNGAALSAIKWANLTAAIQPILTANAWMPTDVIMAPRSLVGYANMVDTLGQPLRRPDMLQPLNFRPTPAIPVNLTVGTSSDCSEMYVGAFSQAMSLAIRESMTVIRSIELKATTGLVTFVFHMRLDWAIFYPQALAQITGIRAN